MRVAICIGALSMALGASPAFAQSGGASGDSASDRAEARNEYRRGVEAYDSGRFAEALEQLRRSFAHSPSPNSRLYVARSLRELGQFAEAVNEFEATATEAASRAGTEPRYAATRDAARAEQLPLFSRVARVRLAGERLPPDARVRMGTVDVPREALGSPFAVPPGTVDIEVTAPGRETYRTTLMTVAGSESQIDVVMREATALAGGEPAVAAAEHPISLRNEAFALMGVGVVGFAAAGVFAALAGSQYNGLLERCGGAFACPESERGAIQTGMTYDTLTSVGIGVGIVGVLSGAALYALFGRNHSENRVHIGLGPTSVTLGGSF